MCTATCHGRTECSSCRSAWDARRLPPADPITDEGVAALARVLRHRVLRLLRERGKLSAEGADDDPDELHQDSPLLATLAAAAVQGRTALGPRAGAYAERLGHGSAAGGESRGKLCADCEGSSLHAGICVPHYSRERLEKLCRYNGQRACGPICGCFFGYLHYVGVVVVNPAHQLHRAHTAPHWSGPRSKTIFRAAGLFSAGRLPRRAFRAA